MYGELILTDVVKVVGAVTGVVVICYFIKLVVHVVLINTTIEKFHRQREEELEKAQNPGMTISGFETIKKTITEKYDKKLNPLPRRKVYIFDILPFIPKK